MMITKTNSMISLYDFNDIMDAYKWLEVSAYQIEEYFNGHIYNKKNVIKTILINYSIKNEAILKGYASFFIFGLKRPLPQRGMAAFF